MVEEKIVLEKNVVPPSDNINVQKSDIPKKTDTPSPEITKTEVKPEVKLEDSISDAIDKLIVAQPKIDEITQKLLDKFSISADEVDALKETANIGTGHAAIALSNIFNRKVNISLPDLKLTKMADVARCVDCPNEMIVGIHSKMKEGMEGNIVLMMPFNVALDMAKVFLPDGGKDSTRLNEKEKKLLQKIGTATYLSYLTSLAKFFENKISFDPPNIISTFGESVFDFITLDVNSADEVVIIKLGFAIEDTKLKGDFFLLFTIKSLTKLLDNIKNKMAEG